MVNETAELERAEAAHIIAGAREDLAWARLIGSGVGPARERLAVAEENLGPVADRCRRIADRALEALTPAEQAAERARRALAEGGRRA